MTEAPKTAAEAMTAAGLDWNVEMRPIYTPTTEFLQMNAEERRAIPNDKRGVELPDHRAVVRAKDSKVLGVVGKKYHPLQNSEAFGFMDPFLADGSVTFETAGSLTGGRIVWVLGRLKESIEVVPGDTVRQYVLITNSHDGSRLVTARFTPIRVVCWNTLSAAAPAKESKKDAAKDNAIKVRHTATVSERVTEAGLTLKTVYDASAATAELFAKLAEKKVTTLSALEILKELVPDNADAKSNTRTKNIRADITTLMAVGKGAAIPGVKGTAWGLYNAITEYVDHPKKDGAWSRDKAESKLNSQWFGTGKDFKDKALALLATV